MGNTASEMQHLANQLELKAGDEKRFLDAVHQGKCLEASALLRQNPNLIYARTGDWHNGWHLAAKSGNLAMLEVLHRMGQDPDGGGTTRAVRKPLPGEVAPYCSKTRTGRDTPLIMACAAGHITAMQYLISIGADVRDGDKFGNTIVHYAAFNGQVKMLELLLATDEGITSRSAAVGAVAGGADAAAADSDKLVDLRNEAGLTPLHAAVWAGQEATAKVLISYGADPSARSTADSCAQVTCNGGSTPLHVAALRDDVGMVQLLLDAQAEGRIISRDLRLIPDNYKYSPLALAQNLKRTAVLDLLQPPKPPPGGASEPPNVKRNSAQRPLAGSPLLTSPPSMRVRDSNSVGAGDPASGAASSTADADVDDGFAALAAGFSPNIPSEASPARSSQPNLPGPARGGSGVHGADGEAGHGGKQSGGAAKLPVLLPPPPPPKASIKLAPPPAAALPPTPPPPTPAAPITSAGSGIPAAAPAAPAVPAAAAAAAAAAVPRGDATPAQTSEASAPAAKPPAAGGGVTPAPAPPAHFVCPITGNIMQSPVTAEDGRNYEKEAITMWFELGNKEYPGSDFPITSQDLLPNTPLAAAIVSWLAKRKAA